MAYRSTLATLLLLASSSSVQAQMKVPWHFVDVPPCTNLLLVSGQPCSKLETLVFSRIKAFEFVPTVTSLPRMMSMMRNRELFCTMDLLENPQRAQFLEYSDPAYTILPPVLVVNPKNNLLSNIDGDIKLDMLPLSEFKIGVKRGQFYSRNINDFIEQYINNMTVYKASNEQTLIGMLQGQRLDAIFMTADDLHSADPQGNLSAYLVAEEPMITVSFACTKTSLGMQVMKSINSVIAEFKVEERAMPYIETLPEGLKSRYLARLLTP